MAAGATVTDRCTQYALDVVAGVIIAGEYVRLACQRHLDDIEKAKAAPYKYYFDVEKCKHCPFKDGCYKDGAKSKSPRKSSILRKN